jgi:hypothetical protein
MQDSGLAGFGLGSVFTGITVDSANQVNEGNNEGNNSGGGGCIG